MILIGQPMGGGSTYYSRFCAPLSIKTLDVVVHNLLPEVKKLLGAKAVNKCIESEAYKDLFKPSSAVRSTSPNK
jgi:hypothetical protein